MKDMGIVLGNEEQAKPIIIGKDTVYVHTDIEKVEGIDEMTGEPIKGLYRYHEIQYTLEEYEELKKTNPDMNVE